MGSDAAASAMPPPPEGPKPRSVWAFRQGPAQTARSCRREAMSAPVSANHCGSGKMNCMKLSSLLAIALCALPLSAQAQAPAAGSAALPAQASATGSAALPDSAPAAASPRRVAAPCQLTSAQLGLSGEESPDQGRGYSFQVANNSTRTIAMPGTPGFGWRVETLQKNGWKLKAEGGPVRLVTTSGRTDPHVAVTGGSASISMVQIAPTHAFDYSFFLPGAEAALRPDPGVMLTTLKLTVYWAAPADLAQSNRGVPLCSLAGEWDVKIQAP